MIGNLFVERRSVRAAVEALSIRCGSARRRSSDILLGVAVGRFKLRVAGGEDTERQ